MTWLPRFAASWALVSIVAAAWWAMARRACPQSPTLDERIGPHVASELDERIGWVGFSKDRWPA